MLRKRAGTMAKNCILGHAWQPHHGRYHRHGHYWRSLRQIVFTQDWSGGCTPWEEATAFLVMEQFMVFMKTFFLEPAS